eukprot:339670-Pyramimonas_sp.AAC.2
MSSPRDDLRAWRSTRSRRRPAGDTCRGLIRRMFVGRRLPVRASWREIVGRLRSSGTDPL